MGQKTKMDARACEAARLGKSILLEKPMARSTADARVLDEYELKALFFITGYMAEKLSNFPQILDSRAKRKFLSHLTIH